MTQTHNWVSMRFTPVEAILGDDGEPRIFMIEAGEDRVGCMDCDSPLTATAMKTECRPSA